MSSESPTPGRSRVVGVFTDPAHARAAEDALVSAGVAREAIIIAGGDAPAPATNEREAGFLWRLVLVVVFWSIVGAVAGVGIGIVLVAAGVGPGGATGLAIQIAGWAIFAHLMAGMWAGYALLTSGESRRAAADPRTVVSVSGDAASCARHAEVLREAGATAVAVYDAAGKRAG